MILFLSPTHWKITRHNQRALKITVLVCSLCLISFFITWNDFRFYSRRIGRGGGSLGLGATASEASPGAGESTGLEAWACVMAGAGGSPAGAAGAGSSTGVGAWACGAAGASGSAGVGAGASGAARGSAGLGALAFGSSSGFVLLALPSLGDFAGGPLSSKEPVDPGSCSLANPRFNVGS